MLVKFYSVVVTFCKIFWACSEVITGYVMRLDRNLLYSGIHVKRQIS